MSKRIKHEVKVLTYHEMGVKLDDQLDAAKAEQSSFDGAKKALSMGRAKVEELTAHIDKDVQNGTMDLDQSTLAKRWVLRAMAVLQNLAIQAEVQMYQSQGKVMALTTAVTNAKTLYEAEKTLLDAAIAAEKAQSEGVAEAAGEPGRPVARLVGEHPGNPLADRKESEVSDAEQQESDGPKRKRKKG